MKKHVIIIHEIYGVTPNLLSLREELVRRGCSVSLPSLYDDNSVSVKEEDAYERFYSRVGIDGACEKIEKIIHRNPGSEISLLGFSVGATIAWLSSRNRAVSQVIGIYGSAIRKYLDVQPSVSTHLLFTRESGFDAEALQLRLQKRPHVTSAMIPGYHGFYSREAFSSTLIESLNRDIFRIIETP